MNIKVYRDFHPHADFVRDGRTINAILRKAAKILGIDWKAARLHVDTPFHYVNYNHDMVHPITLGEVLRKGTLANVRG